MGVGRSLAYFNHAGLSHPVAAVTARMRTAEKAYRTQLFSEAEIGSYYAALEECRRAIAELMGLETPAGISILANASAAIQILLSVVGAPLGPGDTITPRIKSILASRGQ